MTAPRQIRKVGVIGAGVMGAGIAAHCANAGVDVVLLDMPVAGRDLAAEAVARQVKTGGLMHPSFAARLTTGTTDDLSLLADADWVVEAVIEQVGIKRDLYHRLDAVLPADCALSSNTSTIPLAALMADMPASLTRRFLVTHFFNPPRYMRLLEIVVGPGVDPQIAETVASFADHALGKVVVPCKDTPGFLANRIGCLWMSAAVRYALEFGLTVEEADAIIARPFGIPATGIFGLCDLVGIDLMPKVWDSFSASLPPGDAFHLIHRPPPVFATLIAQGATGRKAGAGFFRKSKSGMEVLNLVTLDYRSQEKPTLESLAVADLPGLMGFEDRGGRYAWAVMSRSLAYACALVPEIADTVAPIDTAMRLGYAWRWGPFELIDRIGVAWFAERLAADGQSVPPLLARAVEQGGFYADSPAGLLELTATGSRQPVPLAPGILRIAELGRRGPPVETTAAASLWDMGDGVACLEFHRKLNAMAPESLDAIAAATRRVAADFQALVIGNDADAFSAGADLGRFLAALDAGDLPFIDAFVRRGQAVYDGVLRAPFPVIGAVAGLALGGGCEILLHCDAIQAHAESTIGLVERKVGLVPAWGGCRRLLVRAASAPGLAKGPMPGPAAVFETIVTAATASSAALARDLLFVGAEDRITMNRDRLLADAKARACARVAAGYTPPPLVDLRLPGASGKATLRNRIDQLVPLGLLRGHDLVVADALATILSGGDSDPTRPLPETAISDLEHAAFMDLVATTPTRERIAHMLKTGKALAN